MWIHVWVGNNAYMLREVFRQLVVDPTIRSRDSTLCVETWIAERMSRREAAHTDDWRICSRHRAADTDVSNSARCSRKQAGTKQKSVKASSGCRSQLVTAAGDRGDAREELASGILLDFATTKARILDRHEKAICRRPARTTDRSKSVAMPLFTGSVERTPKA